MDKRDDFMADLEQLPTEQLAQMLRKETDKEEPDDDLVLQMLHTLEKRKEVDFPALGERGQAAWEHYQAKRARGHIHLGWAMRAASLAVAACLLFALIPQQATAGSFWKILNRWTAEFFEFVNIGASPAEPEPYVFHSDNPGLQEVYAAVTEDLGITDPVVPQWLPEGYELKDLEEINTHSNKGIIVWFAIGENEAVLSYKEMEIDLSPQYEKSVEEPQELEVNGIIHNYMQNNHRWTVCWTRQNIKCAIGINCQEEELTKIIQSIYE